MWFYYVNRIPISYLGWCVIDEKCIKIHANVPIFKISADCLLHMLLFYIWIYVAQKQYDNELSSYFSENKKMLMTPTKIAERVWGSSMFYSYVR